MACAVMFLCTKKKKMAFSALFVKCFGCKFMIVGFAQEKMRWIIKE
jgi:hypothetical protein